MLQALFTCLLTLQFLVVVTHDWVHLPGWTHGRQVQEVVGRRKLLLATLINAVFPGVAAGTAIYFVNRPKPAIVSTYWLIYCAVTVASAAVMWYIPYWFGASEGTRNDYSRMYAGTRHILPARDDNPRPNLLHLCFHALFLINLGLAVALHARIR